VGGTSVAAGASVLVPGLSVTTVNPPVFLGSSVPAVPQADNKTIASTNKTTGSNLYLFFTLKTSAYQNRELS
jgi:hypothetical protein